VYRPEAIFTLPSVPRKSFLSRPDPSFPEWCVQNSPGTAFVHKVLPFPIRRFPPPPCCRGHSATNPAPPLRTKCLFLWVFHGTQIPFFPTSLVVVRPPPYTFASILPNFYRSGFCPFPLPTSHLLFTCRECDLLPSPPLTSRLPPPPVVDRHPPNRRRYASSFFLVLHCAT